MVAKRRWYQAAQGGHPVSETQDRGVDRDEQQLAELGYRQELSRAWSGFTNFAISFTIVPVRAGPFTTFLYAWQNGGPIAASWGWAILSVLVLMVAFSMAELTSKYP